MNVKYVTIYPDGYETSETVTAEQAVSLAIEHDAECVFEDDDAANPLRPKSLTIAGHLVTMPSFTLNGQIQQDRGPSPHTFPFQGTYTLKKVICIDRTKGLPLTGLYHDREHNVIWYDKLHDYYACIADENCDFMVGCDYKPKPPFTPIMNEFDIKDIRKEEA